MLARGFGECLDATVEAEARPVERDLRDTLRLRTLGDRATNGRSGVGVARRLQPFAHGLLHGRRGGDDGALLAVDDLRINVARRPVHGQARDAELLDLQATARSAAQPRTLLVDDFFHSGYFFFASLSSIFSPE